MSKLKSHPGDGRRLPALITRAGSAGLFAIAGLVTFRTTTRAPDVVVRPAALALTTPVVVASRAAASPFSLVSFAPTVAVLSPERPFTPPSPAWDLANIANPRVDHWVSRFMTSLKNDFAAALSRKKIYSDMISTKLAARQMPDELIYLAMIESDFKPKARSRVSAVGLWQFMASTARRFGLSVGSHADERTNPAKATDAALAYLDELHDQFGSWYLAAAAYNAGPGTVARALQRVTNRRTGTDADFYRIAPRLPRETRDYVPKLIAAARIGKQPGSYGFTD